MKEEESVYRLNKDTVILLASTLIIALCGLLYELLIGSTSSYLLGDSVKQFSLTIGIFMTSFGVGSYISKYVKKNIVFIFFIVEIIIGFLGSISILSLFYSYSISSFYYIVMYFFIISIGVLVGLEIPLIGRIIDRIKKDVRVTLADLLSFDYLGSMVGSLVLPLVLLPYLGLIKSSILVGIGNLIVALLVGYRYRKNFSKKYLLIPIVLIFIDIFAFVNAKSIQLYIEQKFYDDPIIYQNRSRYQKIILTKDGNDLRMFLDGNIQFSSIDEYRYHESLVHIPIAAFKKKNSERVLILGGGDGLAARELLKYSSIKEIVICDLDKAITDLCRKHYILRKLNKNSLQNPKVKIVNSDAFAFLQNRIKEIKNHNNIQNNKWDFIIVDLPDPNNEGLSKLYSVKFYKMILALLKKDGISVVQSTSPYHARNVFWCIYNTIKVAGAKKIFPYKTYIPSFGIWGFIMFSNGKIEKPIKIENKKLKFRYLNSDIITSLFSFPNDTSRINTEVNKIFQPVILRYYENSWKNY